MDEAGRAYEAELQAYEQERKRIAAAGMPGIVRGAPNMQHTLGGRFPSPLEEMAKRAQDDYDRRDQHANWPPRGSWTPASGLNTPVQSASHRIAELAKQVTESGHMLAEARAQHRDASISREKCELQFAQVREALTNAMLEHQEGGPEGVPYQAEGMR